MDVYLCDRTVSHLLDSIVPQVRSAYKEQLRSGGLDLVAVGPSGKFLVERLVQELSSGGAGDLRPHILDVGEKGGRVEGVPAGISGRDVLLCDCIVNSGASLSKVRRHLLGLGAKSVRTLSLVVRSDAGHIPNFYAITIDRHDDVFFGSDPFPVRGSVVGTIRRADSSDQGRALQIEEAYVNASVDDFLLECAKDESAKTYLIESPEGTVVGLLHFLHGTDGTAYLDTVVVEERQRGKGYGGALLEFFDSYCRFHRVSRCTLFAPQKKLSMYQAIGYVRTGKSVPNRYGDEAGELFEMEKRDF
jgi:GNAT superfamily N-acetyltransferase